MKARSPGELKREMEETQAVWDKLSGGRRDFLLVSGYAGGQEPWALFLLRPGDQYPPRLLFVQELGGILTRHWVV